MKGLLLQEKIKYKITTKMTNEKISKTSKLKRIARGLAIAYAINMGINGVIGVYNGHQIDTCEAKRAYYKNISQIENQLYSALNRSFLLGEKEIDLEGVRSYLKVELPGKLRNFDSLAIGDSIQKGRQLAKMEIERCENEIKGLRETLFNDTTFSRYYDAYVKNEVRIFYPFYKLF